MSRNERPNPEQVRRISWAVMISIATLGMAAVVLDLQLPAGVLVVAAVVTAAVMVVLVVATIRALR